MTIAELKILFEQKTKYLLDRNMEDDRRTARICCTIANVNRSKKSKTYKENDFIPKYKTNQKTNQKNNQKDNKKMSLNQMATVLKVITIANGGVLKNG